MPKKLFPLLILFILLFPTASFSQKKGEIKLYNSAIQADNMASFNKFLAKYPNSIFAPKIQSKIDSLILKANTSVRDAAKAKEILLGLGYPIALAAPYRIDNVEYLLGVEEAIENGVRGLKFTTLKELPDGWKDLSTKFFPLYTAEPALNNFAFCSDTLKAVTVDSLRSFSFIYSNSSSELDPRTKWENNNTEVIFNLYCIADGSLHNAMFAGERIDSLTIEGNCMEAVQSGIGTTPQMNYLIKEMREESSLRPFSEERTAIKKSIENWYERNPDGSTSLNFIALNENNPIVNLYKESKYRDKNSLYSAALVEVMQTTLICIYATQTGQYLLIWCEPAADREDKKAKYLNTIYFEGNSTLILYYDQNNKMIKERINIPSRKKQ